jgi:centromere-localized protein 2
MAPSEEEILKQYLVAPSHLPAVVSLDQFKEFFPHSLRSSSRIRSLYRDLHSQKIAQLDAVQTSIDTEVKRSKALRRTATKARLEAEREELDLEVEVEKAVSFGVHKGQ